MREAVLREDGTRSAEAASQASERVPYVMPADACNAALVAATIRRPLLLVGETGIGKTSLAEALAAGSGFPLDRVSLDLDTEPRELLWSVDLVERLADAQIAREVGSAKVPLSDYVRPGILWRALNPGNALAQEDGVRARNAAEPVQTESKAPPQDQPGPRVYLIDEIDKASPAVYDAILGALGSRRLHPPGCCAVEVDPNHRFVLILAANDDLRLPQTLVRRCLVYRLDIYDKSDDEVVERLVNIAQTHWEVEDEAVRGGGEFPVTEARELAALLLASRRATPERTPGTAEYVDCLQALWRLRVDEGLGAGNTPRDLQGLIERLTIRKHASQEHRG